MHSRTISDIPLVVLPNLTNAPSAEMHRTWVYPVWPHACAGGHYPLLCHIPPTMQSSILGDP